MTCVVNAVQVDVLRAALGMCFYFRSNSFLQVVTFASIFTIETTLLISCDLAKLLNSASISTMLLTSDFRLVLLVRWLPGRRGLIALLSVALVLNGDTDLALWRVDVLYHERFPPCGVKFVGAALWISAELSSRCRNSFATNIPKPPGASK